MINSLKNILVDLLTARAAHHAPHRHKDDQDPPNRAMTDHEIAVRIMALDEEENIDGWIAKWDPTFADWGKDAHAGDCVKIPMTCLRCTYENTMKRVPDYRRIFNIPQKPDPIV